MTAAELAAAARTLIGARTLGTTETRDTETMSGVATATELAGIWPRAVALLGRQALEQGLDDLWSAVARPVKDVSRHAQLLCLGSYVTDADLVSDVRHAWHGLSEACHHHAYELAPTAAELTRWLDGVERFLRYDPVQPR